MKDGFVDILGAAASRLGGWLVGPMGGQHTAGRWLGGSRGPPRSAQGLGGGGAILANQAEVWEPLWKLLPIFISKATYSYGLTNMDIHKPPSPPNSNYFDYYNYFDCFSEVV